MPQVNLDNIVYKKTFQTAEKTSFPDSVTLTIEKNFYAVWFQDMSDQSEDNAAQRIFKNPELLAGFTLWERDRAMEFAVMTGQKTLEEIKKMPKLEFNAEVAQ